MSATRCTNCGGDLSASCCNHPGRVWDFPMDFPPDPIPGLEAEIARLTAERDAAMAGRAEPVSGALFIDQDGDVCINDGRKDNLVFCPAADEDGKPLCPDVVAEIVRRFNAPQPAPAPQAREITVQEAADVLPNSWDLARVIWEARKYAAWGKDAGSKLIERTPWQKHSAHPMVATEHELAHAEAKAVLTAIAAMQKGG